MVQQLQLQSLENFVSDVHSLDVSSAHIMFSLFLSPHGFFSSLIFLIVFYFNTRERGGETQQLTLIELQCAETNLRGQSSKACWEACVFWLLLSVISRWALISIAFGKKKRGGKRKQRSDLYVVHWAGSLYNILNSKSHSSGNALTSLWYFFK